jgi:hypothetical protein
MFLLRKGAPREVFAPRAIVLFARQHPNPKSDFRHFNSHNLDQLFYYAKMALKTYFKTTLQSALACLSQVQLVLTP